MNRKQKKIKQFEEIEINETYKDSPSSSKNNDSQNNEMNQTDHSINYQESEEQKFDFNVIPIKVVALTVFLFLLGIVFIIVGIIFFLKNTSKYQQYISLLIVGSLMLIPGVYYTRLLIRFIYADSRQTQQKILNDLPID